MDACFSALTESLNQIGIDFGRADYFITHLHADHLGLAGRLTEKVLMSETDAKIIESFGPESLYEYAEYFKMNGFPVENAEKILNVHPWMSYSGNVTFIPVKDGEILNYGKYSLKAVLTPGHTPGHMCLYDEKRGSFFLEITYFSI